MVKNPPAMQEILVQSLGWEDPLKKEMASHTSILTWGIPWREEPGGYSPRGGKESDMTEQLTLLVSHQTSDNSDSKFSSVQSLSHVWLCDPMYRLPCPSPTPAAFSNYVHRVGDAIQSSHPLLSPSPPALNLPQHQGPLQWVSSSHQVAKALELQLQHQSFQWIFRIDFLQNALVGFPCSPRDSQESSPTPQFKSINSLALSFLILNLSFFIYTRVA